MNKPFFLGCLLGLLLVTNDSYALVGTGTVGSIATNPADQAVLVQTAALNSGSVNASPSANWTVVIWYSCSATATFEYQVMNGASSVSNILMYCPGGTTNKLEVPGISFLIPNGFTIRMINVGALTGTAQASIFYAMETVN